MNDYPNVELGKNRYEEKFDITGRFKLPNWWRLPERVRWSHTERNYRKSYDAWTAEFTFATRKYSGQWLVDDVRKRFPRLDRCVFLDAGCGSNPYKSHLPNVIGFDPGDWGGADVQWGLPGCGTIGAKQPVNHYIADNSVDAIFAIGPANHGDTTEIEEMFSTLHGLLKPRGLLYCLVKPANWAHLQVDPWRENRGLCYPWTRPAIGKFGDLCEFEFEMEPVLDGTDLGVIPTEKLEALADIEPWERTLNGAPPVETEVQDGDMYSQWQAVQRELARRINNPDAPSEIIRQRWFWIWKKI